MIVFLSVFAVFIVVGIGALAMRNRSERGIESGIDSFRRELDALAPRGEAKSKSPSRKPNLSRADDVPAPGPAEDADPAEPEASEPEPEPAAEGGIRTVQVGERPPPPRPRPSVKPTGVAPPKPIDSDSGEAGSTKSGPTESGGDAGEVVDGP